VRSLVREAIITCVNKLHLRIKDELLQKGANFLKDFSHALHFPLYFSPRRVS
jgi:hypothetical protein